ncbi:nucleoside triphosphate pyrophosphohydrolase [bacterium]|nr:nucleoside triphosphate pyrophosphohydrolase [bacterium]
MRTEDRFMRLVRILKRLRGKDGCPWDRKQTYTTLRPLMLEELYEIFEAIDESSFDKLKEELGDLLMHILFQAELAEEEGKFTLDDVIDGISDKLVRRHPHVFGDVEVSSTDEILANWAKIKMLERAREGSKVSALDGVPKELPALLRAQRVQQKASRVGFDWQKKEDVVDKVNEELEELKQAIRAGDKDGVEEELGDLLFAITNLARFLDISAEMALLKSVKKFEERFRYIEEKLDKPLSDATLEEMDELWNKSKEE